MLHDDTTAAIRAWIDRRTSELPANRHVLITRKSTQVCRYIT